MSSCSITEKIIESFGVTLGKAEVARALRCKVSSVDAISPLVLPKIKGKGGSSPSLYLALDVAHFLKHRGSIAPLDKNFVKTEIEKSIGKDGEFITREEIASVLHVSPVTISRSSDMALKPVVEARGCKPGAYLASNLVDLILKNRVVSDSLQEKSLHVTDNAVTCNNESSDRPEISLQDKVSA